MGGEHQFLAGGTQNLAHGRDHHRGVADDHDEVAVRALDQQTAVDGLGCLLGHGGQQHRFSPPVSPAAARRHGDGEIGGDITDQRRGDATQRVVLRPVQLRGGLPDRKQWGQDREGGAQDSGDDGDETGGSVVRPVCITALDRNWPDRFNEEKPVLLRRHGRGTRRVNSRDSLAPDRQDEGPYRLHGEVRLGEQVGVEVDGIAAHVGLVGVDVLGQTQCVGVRRTGRAPRRRRNTVGGFQGSASSARANSSAVLSLPHDSMAAARWSNRASGLA